ncbi:unnamed protein product, partial [Rotaria sp. Silwood1]
CLLSYCYELLDLPKINIKLRNNIYNHISYQNQTFDNIEKRINQLSNFLPINIVPYR